MLVLSLGTQKWTPRIVRSTLNGLKFGFFFSISDFFVIFITPRKYGLNNLSEIV